MNTLMDLFIRAVLIAFAVCCVLFLMGVIIWTFILLDFPH